MKQAGIQMKRRRGGTLMWSVGALAVAMALTPIYVGMCSSLANLTGRGARRLIATNTGAAELERIRGGATAARNYDVPELPKGRCEVTAAAEPGSALRQVTVRVSWDEGRTTPAYCEWTTLAAAGDQR